MADEERTQQSLSEIPFLDKEEKHDEEFLDCDEVLHKRPKTRSWLQRNRSAVICHGLMISCYLLITAVLWNTHVELGSGSDHLLFTPIKDNIRYVVKEIKDSPRDIVSSEYVGTPTPETEKAWERLTRFHNLRITEEEMHAMNLNTSNAISFARGGGYHGMMGVFHELHCLKLVREATRPDHYYKNKGKAERAVLAGHTDHCIEILRMGAMCRADPMIFPYHWVDANRVPNPTWIQNHECVDWDHFEEWLETRRVDIHAPNVLVHPLYGPTYPGGKSIKESNGPQWYPLDPE
ncbi:uncharacterized protein EKO05_0009063 [Ascochyta rabiei]|uniref:Uncharacterized protein n=1 Tax=Didymella rabiei TaxID=5454 RepID=A0A163INR5_DIDRA|nr:uncharacterized protein EKO05_0009063 [Ascochyta rabiei]KZM25849.1 hypothetical protein ST47_g2866 [Ascochyta rabiei]UPX18772.1 hypothetical protein EKO05_0009063 [Ascochyta rabiei]